VLCSGTGARSPCACGIASALAGGPAGWWRIARDTNDTLAVYEGMHVGGYSPLGHKPKQANPWGDNGGSSWTNDAFEALERPDDDNGGKEYEATVQFGSRITWTTVPLWKFLIGVGTLAAAATVVIYLVVR
jgi:hypothetical protein